MERTELLNNEGYWIAKLQTNLYRELSAFMERNKMNSTQLANHLGCSKSYVSQLLNGNFDHKISKLVELSLAIGKAPVLEFIDINSLTENEKESQLANRYKKATVRQSKNATSATC